MRRRPAAAKAGGAWLMLALLLFLEAAAAWPALHAAVCPDAGRSQDHCAVAQFAAGFAESSPGPAPTLIPTREGHLPCLPWRQEVHPTSPLFRLASCRPPPA
ncbi:MAG: hypothetical protein HS113_04105 [Verrucomicrobiales bacterium]|nr:hypothetical protein [Verrucomicrobiales bacterium]